MKKNIFRVAAFSALLALGVSGAQAQTRNYDCPPLNPEYQAQAEQIVSLQMDDPEKAGKVYMALEKKIKKNKEDLVAVGTYFLENNELQGASQCAKLVYTLDPTYIPGLMFSAEVFMKFQKWGEAGARYDEVLANDPTNVGAMKRNAFVYKNINPHAAIDYLNKIKEIDPSFTEADLELGNIYYKLDDYAKAIESYKVYYAATPKDTTHLDIRACENYLQALFSMSVKNEDYLDTIIQIANEVKPLAPKDIIIPRMEFFAKYNKVETAMDYDGALKNANDAAAYIRDKQFPDSVYFYMDFDYAAKLAKENRNYPEAITYYEAAVKDLEEKSLPSKKIRRRKRTSINVVLTTTKFQTSTFVTSRLTRVSKYSKNTLHSLATRPISLTNINLVPSIWQVGSKKTILPNKRKLTTTRLNKLLRTYLLLKQRINCLRFSHTKCWHVSTTLIPTNLSMLYATTM